MLDHRIVKYLQFVSTYIYLCVIIAASNWEESTKEEKEKTRKSTSQIVYPFYYHNLVWSSNCILLVWSFDFYCSLISDFFFLLFFCVRLFLSKRCRRLAWYRRNIHFENLFFFFLLDTGLFFFQGALPCFLLFFFCTFFSIVCSTFYFIVASRLTGLQ